MGGLLPVAEVPSIPVSALSCHVAVLKREAQLIVHNCGLKRCREEWRLTIDDFFLQQVVAGSDSHIVVRDRLNF